MGDVLTTFWFSLWYNVGVRVFIPKYRLWLKECVYHNIRQYFDQNSKNCYNIIIFIFMRISNALRLAVSAAFRPKLVKHVFILILVYCNSYFPCTFSIIWGWWSYLAVRFPRLNWRLSFKSITSISMCRSEAFRIQVTSIIFYVFYA